MKNFCLPLLVPFLFPGLVQVVPQRLELWQLRELLQATTLRDRVPHEHGNKSKNGMEVLEGEGKEETEEKRKEEADLRHSLPTISTPRDWKQLIKKVRKTKRSLRLSSGRPRRASTRSNKAGKRSLFIVWKHSKGKI